jgi:hypothetical protein
MYNTHRPVIILNITTFRRLDSVPVFKWNPHSWAQSIELVQSYPVKTGRWIMSRNKVIVEINTNLCIIIRFPSTIFRVIHQEKGRI